MQFSFNINETSQIFSEADMTINPDFIQGYKATIKGSAKAEVFVKSDALLRVIIHQMRTTVLPCLIDFSCISNSHCPITERIPTTTGGFANPMARKRVHWS